MHSTHVFVVVVFTLKTFPVTSQYPKNVRTVLSYRIDFRGHRLPNTRQGYKKIKKQKQNGSSQKNQRRIKNQHTVVETKTGKKLSGAKSTKDIHMSIRGI